MRTSIFAVLATLLLTSHAFADLPAVSDVTCSGQIIGRTPKQSLLNDSFEIRLNEVELGTKNLVTGSIDKDGFAYSVNFVGQEDGKLTGGISINNDAKGMDYSTAGSLASSGHLSVSSHTTVVQAGKSTQIWEYTLSCTRK